MVQEETQIIERSHEADWSLYPILITVTKSHVCYKCFRYRILAGQKAVKFMGQFTHYPKCPKSKKENQALVETLQNERK